MTARGGVVKNVRKIAAIYYIRCLCEKDKRKTPHKTLIYKEYYVGFHNLSQQVSH